MQLILATYAQISLAITGKCEWISELSPIMTNLTWFSTKTGPIIVQMSLFLVLFWRKPLNESEKRTLASFCDAQSANASASWHSNLSSNRSFSRSNSRNNSFLLNKSSNTRSTIDSRSSKGAELLRKSLAQSDNMHGQYFVEDFSRRDSKQYAPQAATGIFLNLSQGKIFEESSEGETSFDEENTGSLNSPEHQEIIAQRAALKKV